MPKYKAYATNGIYSEVDEQDASYSRDYNLLRVLAAGTESATTAHLEGHVNLPPGWEDEVYEWSVNDINQFLPSDDRYYDEE